jgi:hypothetical protein
LLTPESLQERPLVEAGRVLMSVAVPASEVPVGLREQSRVTLVVTPGDTYGDVELPAGPLLVEAVVAAVPGNLVEVVDGDAGPGATISLSVEVDESFVALVGSASAISVGVLDPAASPERAAVPAAADDPNSAPSTSTGGSAPSTTQGAAATTVAAVAPSTTAAGEAVAGTGSSGGDG